MTTSKKPSRQSWVEAYAKALLKSGADVNQTDKNGVTPLHHAVRFRSPAAVRTLLEHGALVNQACTRSGSTPLHRAVTSTGAPGTAGKQGEAIQIIDILLEFGANPALKNKLGKKAADYARDPEILQRLKVGVRQKPGKRAKKS
jgi:tankyrase